MSGGIERAASGGPWPSGKFGEVVSPSGRRSYPANRAAAHAGRTTRWATSLAKLGRVSAERGHVEGRQGGLAWFLLADDFEELGRRDGWWPPADHASEWGQLLHLQGNDLEAARHEVVMLREQIRRLTIENARLQNERSKLLKMISSLGKIARKTRP
jgi:hypothetical protein